MRASKFTEGRKRGEMWGEFTSGVFRESLLFGWKKSTTWTAPLFVYVLGYAFAKPV